MKELTHDERLAIARKYWDAGQMRYEGQPLLLIHLQTWDKDQHDCYQIGRQRWIAEGMR